MEIIKNQTIQCQSQQNQKKLNSSKNFSGYSELFNLINETVLAFSKIKLKFTFYLLDTIIFLV